MVELRNGKQADQAGIHQAAEAHHANAKRKDSLAYEHGNHAVSHVDAGDDLPRILEEIGEVERKQEREQRERQQKESWHIDHGFDGVFEHHQEHGQLSLPQDDHEDVQSIPQKRAHSDISLLNFDDDDIHALDGEQLEEFDEVEEWQEQGLEDMLREHESKQEENQGGLGEQTVTGSDDVKIPIQPPDRRPTPGRINNPRAVNEEGAAPVYSRGVVDEFPWKADPDYSRRTHLDMDEHGQSSESADAPERPPKKGRYTDPERLEWEEEQPCVNPDDFFHATHLCASRGPNGPPTYDSAGYLLDYEKCLKVTQPSSDPRSLRESWKAEEKRMGHDGHEALEMAHLFFEPGAAPAEEDIHPNDMDHWRDRVSKDLGVPWHAIGLEQFREWDQRGFAKAKKGEYRDFDQVEKERMMELHSGSYFRSGCRLA